MRSACSSRCAGRWRSVSCWRWPMSRSTPRVDVYLQRDLDERSAPWPRPSWHRPPTAPATSICMRSRRAARTTASSPTRSCKSCPRRTARAAVHRARRRCAGDAARRGAGGPGWTRSARVACRRRTARPCCRARQRPATAALRGDGWPLRDDIDAHLSSLAWVLALVWMAASGATARSATGWRRGRWRRWRDLRRAARIARGDFAGGPTSRRSAGRGRRDDAMRSTRSSIACTARSRPSPLRVRRLARTAHADHRHGRRDRRRAAPPAHCRRLPRHPRLRA